MERIYIKEAARQIGCIDRRTFRRWCANNRVSLLKDTGCSKLFVVKSEFEEATLRTINKYLDGKQAVSKLRTLPKSNYKPSGDNEKKFLASLT